MSNVTTFIFIIYPLIYTHFLSVVALNDSFHHIPNDRDKFHKPESEISGLYCCLFTSLRRNFRQGTYAVSVIVDKPVFACVC